MTESSNFDKAFDSNQRGDKRNLRVYLINPPSDNSWHTHQDYINEQKQLTKAMRWTIAAAIAAIVSAVFAGIIAFTAINELQALSQESQKQSSQVQQEPKNPRSEKVLH